jgi:hypothetical protein
MTVGRWVGDYWNQHSRVDSDWWEEWHDANDAWMAFPRFEEYIGLELPEIGPRFVCRYYTLGPLSQFPRLTCNIEVNVLHDPDLLKYGSNLVVGAINIVYIGSLGDDPAEDVFVDHASMIAEGLVDAFEEWTEVYDSDVVAATLVTFAICRESPSNVLVVSSQDKDDESTLAMWLTFRRRLHDSLGPGKELSLSWDVCWADEEGDCPACQPNTCHPNYRIDPIL